MQEEIIERMLLVLTKVDGVPKKKNGTVADRQLAIYLNQSASAVSRWRNDVNEMPLSAVTTFLDLRREVLIEWLVYGITEEVRRVAQDVQTEKGGGERSPAASTPPASTETTPTATPLTKEITSRKES